MGDQSVRGFLRFSVRGMLIVVLRPDEVLV